MQESSGTTRRGSRTGRRAAGRKAFTLTEILLGIGVLAVGLSMAGALFPAAIKHTQGSTNDLIGMHICQNGLAVALTRLTHPLRYGTWAFQKVGTQFRDCTPQLGAADCQYPVKQDAAAADSVQGYALLARHATTSLNDNDYQLVLISYAKTAPDNVLALKYVTGDTFKPADEAVSQLKVPAGQANYVAVGSLLLEKRQAKWFTRVVADLGQRDEGGSTYAYFLLDRVVDIETNVQVYILCELKSDKTTVVGGAPTMNVLFVRTPLKVAG